MLWHLKVSRYDLGGVWDTNAHPLHTLGDPPTERFNDLLYHTPYQVWDKVFSKCCLQWHKEGTNIGGYVLDKLTLLP